MDLLNSVLIRKAAAHLIGKAGREGVLIGRCNNAGGRIIDAGHLLVRDIAVPFEAARCSVYWHAAIEVTADWRAPGGLVTDVTGAVGVYEILCGPPEAAQS